MSLSGTRDIDYKILNELNDVDLVNICQTNKRADEYCKDQMFWMNRILFKFPGVNIDVLTKYKGNMNWSVYYINDLRNVGRRFGFTLERRDHELVEAAREGRLDHVIILLNKGASHSGIASMAAANGHLDVLKYVVGKGADIHFDNELGLRYASKNGYLDIVKYLVEKGADIHALWDFSLRHASENGHLNVVKYLVEKGANIHAEHDTPVTEAYQNGHIDVVNYLVSRGAPDPRP